MLSGLFAEVQKYLQMSVFSLMSCRRRSLLFAWVGVLIGVQQMLICPYFTYIDSTIFRQGSMQYQSSASAVFLKPLVRSSVEYLIVYDSLVDWGHAKEPNA